MVYYMIGFYKYFVFYKSPLDGDAIAFGSGVCYALKKLGKYFFQKCNFNMFFEHINVILFRFGLIIQIRF